MLWLVLGVAAAALGMPSSSKQRSLAEAAHRLNQGRGDAAANPSAVQVSAAQEKQAGISEDMLQGPGWPR